MSRISGVFYLVMLNNSKWEKYLKREHPDFYNALLRQLVACRQQHIFVSEKGRYETPKEKYKVSINDGSWLIFHPRCKGGNRVHINNMKKNYRKCIRSYASFLRADGIDNVDEMLYYILHYTYYHISFYRGLKITYDKTRPIIDEVIKWIMKKDIEKVDKSEFIDSRKIAAPNEICKNGAIGKARKSEKIKITKQAQRKLTDKEIAERYNPDLTNKENAANIDIGLTRLKEWKKEYIHSDENIEQKIQRLYNPELSWAKNAKIIGHSINTIKKYTKMEEPIAVDSKTVELETTESENQFTEHLDIDDDEIIAHSPDSIKRDFGTAELETTDDENQFAGCQDMDNDDYCRWLFGDEFMENIERERERNARLYGTEDAVKMVV